MISIRKFISFLLRRVGNIKTVKRDDVIVEVRRYLEFRSPDKWSTLGRVVYIERVGDFFWCKKNILYFPMKNAFNETRKVI